MEVFGGEPLWLALLPGPGWGEALQSLVPSNYLEKKK
jgi:hypothetical protein